MVVDPNQCQELVPLVKELVGNTNTMILWLILITIFTCVN